MTEGRDLHLGTQKNTTVTVGRGVPISQPLNKLDYNFPLTLKRDRNKQISGAHFFTIKKIKTTAGLVIAEQISSVRPKNKKDKSAERSDTTQKVVVAQ